MQDFDVDAIERKQKPRTELVIDGRTARRNRNRDAVLDALIELAGEGRVDPPIDAIAERAGVSYRSVYRYFQDRTELLLAAMDKMLSDVWPSFQADAPGEGRLEGRIERFVTSRVAAYRKLAPLTRQVLRLQLTEPTVADQDELLKNYIRERLEEHFAPELAALSADEQLVTLAAIEVAFQFQALEHLAQHRGFDDATLIAVLSHQLRVNLAVTAVAAR